MELRPDARNRLWVRSFWTVPLWLAGGIVSLLYLPKATDPSFGAFVGASAIAVGSIFATYGFQRIREQKAQLELEMTISVIVGEELASNRGRLQALASIGAKDPQGVPLFLLTGPLWLRGGDLVRNHMLRLGWTRDFLARVLALYHNLEEAEGLRWLYVRSIIASGQRGVTLSIAGELTQLSRKLLDELEEVRTTFTQKKHLRPGSLLESLKAGGGRRWRAAKDSRKVAS